MSGFPNKEFVGEIGKKKRTKTLKKELQGTLRLKTAENEIRQQEIWLALKPNVYMRKLSQLIKKYIQALNNEHFSGIILENKSQTD